MATLLYITMENFPSKPSEVSQVWRHIYCNPMCLNGNGLLIKCLLLSVEKRRGHLENLLSPVKTCAIYSLLNRTGPFPWLCHALSLCLQDKLCNCMKHLRRGGGREWKGKGKEGSKRKKRRVKDETRSEKVEGNGKKMRGEERVWDRSQQWVEKQLLPISKYGHY